MPAAPPVTAAARRLLLSIAMSDSRLHGTLDASVSDTHDRLKTQNSRRIAENLRRLETFFESFPSLPFDDEAAKHYGTVRAQLRREGRPIGANDLMIASIALAGSLTLATRDVNDFKRVPGLKVEGW